MESTQYTTDFFIETLGAIPANQWGKGKFSSGCSKFPQHCVLGHCGMGSVPRYMYSLGVEPTPPMAQALINLFKEYLGMDPAGVNNGDFIRFIGFSGPKARIMRALELIKQKQFAEAQAVAQKDLEHMAAAQELIREVTAVDNQNDWDGIQTPAAPIPEEVEEEAENQEEKEIPELIPA